MLLFRMITFDEFHKERELRQIAFISFITACAYILMSFLDRIIVSPDMKGTFIVFHLFVMPSILFVVFILAYKQKYYKFMIRLYMFVPFVGAIYNLYITILSTEEHLYNPERYLGIIGVFVVSGLDLKKAIYTVTAMCVVHISGIFYFDTFTQKELIMYLYWISIAYIFGLIGAYLIDRANKDTYKKHIELLSLLNNKDILMREIHHRVKNNLQVVSSLLALESKNLEDEQAKNILGQNRQRIHSMSLIHEQLYSYNNLESIDFNTYLKSLVDEIKKLHMDKGVDFKIECDEFYISLDNGVSLGLVINEILTNSFKHAFDSNSKDRIIKIKTKVADDKLIINISDNGNGIKENYKDNQFGIKLIKSLVEYQLHGTFECFNENGFVNIITLDKASLST